MRIGLLFKREMNLTFRFIWKLSSKAFWLYITDKVTQPVLDALFVKGLSPEIRGLMEKLDITSLTELMTIVSTVKTLE